MTMPTTWPPSRRDGRKVVITPVDRVQTQPAPGQCVRVAGLEQTLHQPQAGCVKLVCDNLEGAVGLLQHLERVAAFRVHDDEALDVQASGGRKSEFPHAVSIPSGQGFGQPARIGTTRAISRCAISRRARLSDTTRPASNS